MMKKTIVALSALIFSATALADIHIHNPRSRITAPTVKMGGAFMDIHNDSKQDDVLIAATTPRSGKTELHNTVIDEQGVMKMREMANGIPIPAGQTVTLKPGSLHIMFMDLHEPFVEGQTYPLTLKFKNAGEKTVTVSVKDLSNEIEQAHGAMKHHIPQKHDMQHIDKRDVSKKAPPPPQIVPMGEHAGHQH